MPISEKNFQKTQFQPDVIRQSYLVEDGEKSDLFCCRHSRRNTMDYVDGYRLSPMVTETLLDFYR